MMSTVVSFEISPVFKERKTSNTGTQSSLYKNSKSLLMIVASMMIISDLLTLDKQRIDLCAYRSE